MTATITEVCRLLYCPKCNEVYEPGDTVKKNKGYRCTKDNTSLASITSRQYSNWLTKGKPVLQIKKKKSS